MGLVRRVRAAQRVMVMGDPNVDPEADIDSILKEFDDEARAGWRNTGMNLSQIEIRSTPSSTSSVSLPRSSASPRFSASASADPMFELMDEIDSESGGGLSILWILIIVLAVLVLCTVLYCFYTSVLNRRNRTRTFYINHDHKSPLVQTEKLEPIKEEDDCTMPVGYQTEKRRSSCVPTEV